MTAPFVRRAAAAVGLAGLIAGVLLPRAQRPGRLESLLDLRVLLSRHQRLLHFFGDCEPAGYGYLQRVLTLYSRWEANPQKRPLIRYGDFDHKTEYVFEPTRFEIDRSLMIAIGVRDVDTRERAIRDALRGADSVWRLPMDTHLDRLTRIEIELDPSAPLSDDVRLRLFINDRAPTALWTAQGVPMSTTSNRAERRVEFVAPPSLGEFPERATPLAMRFDDALPVRRVTVYGVPIAIDEYDIVTREGGCFTAVRQGQAGRWADLIEELRQRP